MPWAVLGICKKQLNVGSSHHECKSVGSKGQQLKLHWIFFMLPEIAEERDSV